MIRPLGVLLAAMAPAVAVAQATYIDVHVHPVSGAMEEPLTAMGAAGIRAMVLMPTPQVHGARQPWDFESFVAAARRHPAKFAFLGGGGTLNPMIHDTPPEQVNAEVLRRFDARAREILAAGAAGFGEMAAHHLSLTAAHPYEAVSPDHPLFLRLADIAAEAGVLIDLHLDLVARDLPRPARLTSDNPSVLRENLAGFERLLAHNRKATIVWAHAGTDQLGGFTASLAGDLLSRHANLYISIRVAPPHAPVLNSVLRPGPMVDPDWLSVMNAFPDRFMLGGDQFFVGGVAGRGGPGAEFAQKGPMQRHSQAVFLQALPAELARRIGVDNAARLYRIR